MDGDRFDAISRSLANRASRRGALRRFGGGGLGAALLGAAGLRSAAAQDDDEEKTCELVLVATVAVGPNKDEVYEGQLTMVIGSEGAIDDGQLETEDGEEYELVGQATGRALNLRITIDDGQYLSLNGTGQQDILLCRGGIDGTFGGPETGDLGTWYAARRKRNAGATASPTPSIDSSNGDDDDDGGNGDDDASPTEEPGPSPTPCDSTGIDCGSTFVLDPATCECVCPQPYKRCGESCCFGGSVCYDGGGCGCPDGMEACQEVCTPSCPSGEYMDPDSCQCGAETSCGGGETLCNGQCVSIDCASNQLFDDSICMCVNRCSPGQDYCNGTCIDVVNDATNCGFCANVCSPGVPCIAGSCTCPATYDYCASQQKCLPEGSAC